MFRARGLRKVASGGGDEREAITVHEIELERVMAWLAEMERAERLVDHKVYEGLYFADYSGRYEGK